jgi:hypothetical protein
MAVKLDQYSQPESNGTQYVMQIAVLTNSTFLQLRKLSMPYFVAETRAGCVFGGGRRCLVPAIRQDRGQLALSGSAAAAPWLVWEVEDRTLPLEVAWHAKD